ncbi:MAG: hypothetical protein M0R37_11840 [Bacteroidales bacterium]|jgi:hypothetical protein|nr:hypothetical protein [Bacteroidales bacterium]
MNKGQIVEAEHAARVIPATLTQRGLKPLFSDWLLTEDQGATWLFGVLDVARVPRLEDFVRDDLLHHISTALRGRPVFISNSSGLRYAVLLSQPPRLPKLLNFPGMTRGRLRLGMRAGGGEIAVPWDTAGHLLVAGKTGAGKSVFLRLVAHQALGDGAELLLGDLDGVTFPMLAEHPALLAPIATTPEAMHALVERGLGECAHRATLYGLVSGYPDTLTEYNRLADQQGADVLPRVVVILDEFNAAALAQGGANGGLAKAAAELGWRGRKFGVSVVFAAQDFTKAVVGRVRDQIGAAICFRVRSAEVARAVGCAEAASIPASRPGLALSDRWGLLQAYYLDKSLLIQAGEQPGPALTEQERQIITAALADGGRVTLALLQEHGFQRNESRRLLVDWRARGWVEKDPNQQNAHVLTDRWPPLAELAGVGRVGQLAGREAEKDLD